MTFEEFAPYLYFLVAVLLWLLFLYALHRSGKLDKPEGEPGGGFGLALMGPFLMWKTGKGRAFLDWLARRRRFWRAYGDLSLVIVGVAMVVMTALLVWLAVLVVNVPANRAPSPQMLLGIPGINPLIPLWYGILALAISIILHEFCHGILARVANVRLNSLGLLFFIVPVGAFVEPDEGELKAMRRLPRARLFAAGPATNIVVAFVMALVFSSVFMAGVTPVADGVGVASVTAGSPAAAEGFHPGMILLSVNNTRIRTVSEFISAMDLTKPGDTIPVTYTAKGMAGNRTVAITLADAGVLYNDPARLGEGALGVTAFPTRLSTAYFHPIGGAGAFGGVVQSTLAYISLPFAGLQPMQGVATQFYVVHGPLAGLGDGFWVLANVFYWVFWLNLMLGLTNALPAVPLDGGYIFRDAVHAILARARRGMAAEQRERFVKNVSYAFALLVLGLILWEFIGPRVL